MKVGTLNEEEYRDVPIFALRGGNSIILPPIEVGDIVAVFSTTIGSMDLLLRNDELLDWNPNQYLEYDFHPGFVMTGIFIESEWGENVIDTFDKEIPQNELVIMSDKDIRIVGADILAKGVDSEFEISQGLFRTGYISELPEPGEEYRGMIVRYKGGAGVADVYYVCMKTTTGYIWHQLDSGKEAFGEIYFYTDGEGIDLATQNQWYQVDCFDINGESKGATPDHTTDDITIDIPGVYFVTISTSFTGNASQTFEGMVKKNNGTVDFINLFWRRTIGTGAEIGVSSISGLIEVGIGDTIEYWVRCTSTVSATITIENTTLSILRVDSDYILKPDYVAHSTTMIIDRYISEHSVGFYLFGPFVGHSAEFTVRQPDVMEHSASFSVQLWRSHSTKMNIQHPGTVVHSAGFFLYQYENISHTAKFTVS